jgi:uncharacterized protein YmfQ (DUF2313 family)
MIGPMAVEKLAISLPSDLAEHARERAASEGTSVSAWIAEAVAQQLRQRSLRQLVADWEAEHGRFTEEEIAAARAQWPA